MPWAEPPRPLDVSLVFGADDAVLDPAESADFELEDADVELEDVDLELEDADCVLSETALLVLGLIQNGRVQKP